MIATLGWGPGVHLSPEVEPEARLGVRGQGRSLR